MDLADALEMLLRFLQTSVGRNGTLMLPEREDNSTSTTLRQLEGVVVFVRIESDTHSLADRTVVLRITRIDPAVVLGKGGTADLAAMFRSFHFN